MMTPTLHHGNRSQVKRNPRLVGDLPEPAASCSRRNPCPLCWPLNAFAIPGVERQDHQIAAGLARRRHVRQMLVGYLGFFSGHAPVSGDPAGHQAGEFILRSGRAGLPEIEELARELSGMNESPDTSLAKWILLSRDHHAIFVRLVEAMSASMSTKSFYARGHSGRVAEYSSLICNELGLSPEESMRIRLSALLHDIGKIGMDQQILTKPGVLDPGRICHPEDPHHPRCGDASPCARICRPARRRGTAP